MARVVGVHGIGQQLEGPLTLAKKWGPPLRDGVQQHGVQLDADDLVCAFYGGLFRPPGGLRASGDPPYQATDLTEDETELLLALWAEAAETEPDRVIAPDAEGTRLPTPRAVQTGLYLLSQSRFLTGIAERAFIGSLKQVRAYLRDDPVGTDPADGTVRDRAQQAVAEVVTSDTQVVVGHSLGSVVAYEALHRFADDPRFAGVTTFVTLGSPLGISNLVFDQLLPAPQDGRGRWPGRVQRWINISDEGDVVALAKRLAPRFGDDLVDIRVHNGAKAHDVSPYLTARETGEVIADALR
jgi:pimeloyl-ACP methyl ester carboxylesterase